MYEIKVLESDEFDEVAKSDQRYSYVDDSNMGFADRQKGVAYVRGTNVHDLNKYLINHELEELEEDESTHEDPNGIRHKKFWKDIIAAFSYNPGYAFTGGSPSSQNKKRDAAHNAEMTANDQLNQQNAIMSLFSPGGGNFSGTVTGQRGQGQASPRISETVTGGIQPGLNQGLNQGVDGIQGLPPDLLQRLKGNYAGREVFR